MPYFRWLAATLLLATIACSEASPVVAIDLFGWRKKPQETAAQPAPCNPSPTVVAAPPGPYRFPAYANGNYPWYGYGFGVPTYGWGYFGSTYRPAVLCHHGYYDDFTQFGYREGY
jgi:hypothetical protein